MSNNLAISCSGIHFAYNQHPVLSDISFSIEQGGYAGVIGPNGGGKTTLLKIMLGLLQPSSGTMSILGKKPIKARKGGQIGYVPQRATQLEQRFPATVLEVVRSGLVNPSMTQKSKADVLEKAMAATDIQDIQHKLIHELSGGQRQRVFITRCLVAKPSILVLDEPVTGVDTPSRDRFYELLKQLNSEHNMTIIFVTHDIDAIAKEVDQVLCINQKICCHTSPQDFLQKHVLDDLYQRPHV